MGKLNVALVLGGGAARGLAHLGVLQVLEKAKIPIDMVVGTSMGALVGAMYAKNPRIGKILPDALRYLHSEQFMESAIHKLRRDEEPDLGFVDQVNRYIRRAQVVSAQVTRQAYFSPEEVNGFFSNFIDDTEIRKLPLPLYIVAADLLTGEQLIIDSGPAIQAVAASSAIPGAFPPVKVGERLCIDGGMVNMVPSTVALKQGADFVIAVNVSHELPKPSQMNRALKIYFRAAEITKRALISHQLQFADVVITPNVGNSHWADFTNVDKMIKAGIESAQERIPAIWALLQKARRRPGFLRKRAIKKRLELIP